MSNITVATWNVHELLSEKSGERFRLELYGASPDLLFLQELPDDAAVDCDSLPHVETWMVEPSVARRDCRMGLGIVSRFPLRALHRVEFDNPRWSRVCDGKDYVAHPKGVILANVVHPDCDFWVACLHLLPPHVFGIDEESDDAIGYLERCAEKLNNLGVPVDILAGDFNSAAKGRVFSAYGFTSSVRDRPTRNTGESHDDILLGPSFNAVAVDIIPSRSDHHIVLAEISTARPLK